MEDGWDGLEDGSGVEEREVEGGGGSCPGGCRDGVAEVGDGGTEPLAFRDG